MKHSFRILLLAAFTSSVMLVESCKKQDITPVDPVIDNSGLTDNKATLKIGDTIELIPALGVGDKPISRIWMRDDSIVSDNYSYTFRATERGEFNVKYIAMNNSGSSTIEYIITVEAPYENGVFILNEGWFGHESGSVNFWHTGADTIETNVYVKNNPGKTLGANTQFGVINAGTLYLASKESPSLVAVEAVSMKETSRIETLPASGRSLLALDANSALISTADGVYKLSLNPLALGDKITGITGEVGNMIKSGNKVLAYAQTQGIVVIDPAAGMVEEEIGAASSAFVESKDGGIWYAYKNGLVKLDPATLNADTVAVNVDIPGQWDMGAWYSASLSYSEADDAIFFLNDAGFAGSSIVYRYKIGDAAFSDQPFITLPARRVFYGAGISVNPETNELIATTVQEGWGDNTKLNDLVIYNASSAAEIKKVSYEHFWFPSMSLSQKSN